MGDDNKLEYLIQIDDDDDELATEFNPHNGKSVTMIVTSPRMKYIATWSEEDKSIVGWKFVDNEQQLKHQYIISKNNINYDEKLRLNGPRKVIFKAKTPNMDENFTYKYFTVSDNKFVTVPIYEEKKNIGIFDFKTKNQLTLNLPGPEFDVGCLAFIESGEFIMFRIDSQINNELEYIDEIFIIPKGKLFIYNSDIGYVTKWDIGTLKFESYFLFKSYYDIKDIKLSDDGLLLFVYGTKVKIEDDLDDSKLFENDSYSTISIYLAKNEMKFTTYTYNKSFRIDGFYLIASSIGARLLIMAYNTEVNSIKAEISEASDKIIETTDDKTSDNDDDDVNFIYNKTFTNYLVKWSVKCNKINDILTAETYRAMDKINARPEI
ncbi:hypothetical protein C2G38_2160702 [Gigaspora rosea]|uniref:Uncharacterized protein n=1 Tax=Gigaspora rosea TaxID=44941 RepID=A0A397VZJ8_9GLOM|nr:hypothetical protein C2G38_2160702 [Gigaspora rosea]